MPLSAMATGKVHLVLPPPAIAEALVRMTRDGISREQIMEEESITAEVEGFDQIALLLKRKVSDRSGHHFLLCALPYRSGDMTEGAVVTLIDMTSLAEPEAEIRLQKKAIEAAINGIVITDPLQPDNPIVYTNRGLHLCCRHRARCQKAHWHNPCVDHACFDHRDIPIGLTFRVTSRGIWTCIRFSEVFSSTAAPVWQIGGDDQV